jgi:uncharacterized delta-60 repeat protein
MKSRYDKLNFIDVQNDDKIIAGGYVIYDTLNSKSAFAAIRYNANGIKDSSFATNGIITYNFNAGNAKANAIKIQSDGKIILAGSAISGTVKGFGAIRLHPDGSLDSTFGNNGQLITSISNTDDRVYSISLHADGRIILVGSSRTGTYSKMAMARYTANGIIDSTFNSTGILLYDQTGNNVIGNGVAIDSVGNYIVSGNTSYSGSSSGFLRKYLSNGTLDTGFGTNGTWSIGVGNGFSDNSTGIITQPDGKMLIGNTSTYTAPKKFAVRRYLPSNWAQDPSFAIGSGGTAYYNSGVTSYAATSLTLQPDGKILVTGNYQNGSIKSIATIRYRTEGILDSTFGNNGLVVTAVVANDNTSSSAIAVQSNGGIIVAGTNTQTNIQRYALMKYNGSTITVNQNEKVKTNDDILFYPNPVHDVLYLKTNSHSFEASIYITDLLGNIVLTDELSEQNTTFNIQNLKVGVYHLKAFYNGKWFTKKLMKT